MDANGLEKLQNLLLKKAVGGWGEGAGPGMAEGEREELFGIDPLLCTSYLLDTRRPTKKISLITFQKMGIPPNEIHK